MFLVEGYGRLCLEHEDGRRITVGLVAPGDLFGEEAFLDIPERKCAFEAVLNSQIDAIPCEEFTRMVTDFPSLLWRIAEHLAQRLLTQQRHMIRLAYTPLERRLAWMLLQLAASTGPLSSAGATLTVYHKDLASILGVRRETVTAMLGRWGTDGLITQLPGRLILQDINQLREKAEEVDGSAS